MRRAVRRHGGAQGDEGKAFPSSGEEQEASSELPLYPVAVFLSPSPFFSRFPIRLPFSPSPPPLSSFPSSSYLDEPEKWFLAKETWRSFSFSNVFSSSPLPSFSPFLSLSFYLFSLRSYKYILRLTLIAGNLAKHRARLFRRLLARARRLCFSRSRL